MRFFIWIAVAIILVYLFQAFVFPSLRRKQKQNDGDQLHSENIEKILQCRHCGVHIPASEAVIDPSGSVFCCKEHQLQHFSGN